MEKEEVRNLIKKYSSELEGEISGEGDVNYSQEYQKFREEALSNLSGYEKWCKSIGKSFTVKLSAKDEEKLNKQIQGARLEVTPGEVAGFATFILLLGFFLSALICTGIFLLGETQSIDTFPFLLFIMLVIISVFIYYYVNSLPQRMEQRWRLKASSQMVPAILYLVVYMRHTSNLERAIKFASEYLQPPLSLDLKKIFWNVQTGKFTTIKDSLDDYLESWREYSLEFVEAFHMIESSLYEPSEERRIAILEKALEIILDGVYEKTLHYTHDVKSPITNVYMLGIVLPTLGLALLPLASTLLGGAVKWYHLAILFNIFIPFLVFYLTNEILSKRPGGFGESELLERNPNYKYYADNSIYFLAFLIALPFLLIGFSPFFLYYFGESLGLSIGNFDPTLGELGIPFLADQKLFGFSETAAGVVGPFGLFALLLSLCIPLAIMIFFTISYDSKTKKLVSMRKETKELENEFAGSMFQLGNRLADGIPAEMAFGRVASSLHDTPTGGFFSLVNINIQQAGMSIEHAIFDKNRGAINQYPSSLVKTSMKILTESVKKGLQVAAKALMSISNYIKNIHKVDERLKDLLADVTSEMKSNMTFLAPLLSAIVVGLSSMITMILVKLKDIIPAGSEQSLGGMNISEFMGMFDVNAMIPPYWMQIIVGIYLIEIIFILTKTLISIESGEDRLGEKSEISKMLKTGILLYIIAAFISIVALTALASVAIGGIAGSL
ncbi:hypothetical protein J4465_00745 [Candidatus Pacearchaeota archaeon]|nr:hypothetical protein [Candidatus Pacearchaeota archaeon]